MARLALVLSCLAILVHFYGILSEHDNITIGIANSGINRFKKFHAYDHVLNNTKPGKTGIEKYKNKEKPKFVKHEPIQANNQTAKIKPTNKSNNPKKNHNFFEDTDAESPIYHHHFKEPTITEDSVKKTSVNKTLEIIKPPIIDKIENVTKKEFPEDNHKESPDELIPRLRTAEPNKDERKNIVKELARLSGRQSITKLPNMTKDKIKEESIPHVFKSAKPELDCKKKDPEYENVIEIKEHKYEEEVVRVYPTKYCEPNIKRNWEASQTFNPMNSYQGLCAQADPYQGNENTYSKDKYYSAYSCGNYKDPNNGNYFYVNFDTKPYNRANEIQRFHQGYGNYNRIRKTWLNRQTKIKNPNNADQVDPIINGSH